MPVVEDVPQSTSFPFLSASFGALDPLSPSQSSTPGLSNSALASSLTIRSHLSIAISQASVLSLLGSTYNLSRESSAQKSLLLGFPGVRLEL